MQSTALCLMAEKGLLGAKPDYAVFADTGWEPESVYQTLARLEQEVSFPIIRTSNGRSLREDVINGVNAQGQPWMTLPVFLREKDGKEAGINWRQCTKNYKIDPIRRAVQEQLGVRAREVLPYDVSVEMWLGITMDEMMRMKPSRNWWIKHRFPLIDDLPMTRDDCKEWVAENYPDWELSRSACIGCPFRNSSSWLDVMKNEPDLFQEAVEIDESLRNGKHNAGQMFRKEAFLHHRRIPLALAVAHDQTQDNVNGFNNECEGHCGL